MPKKVSNSHNVQRIVMMDSHIAASIITEYYYYSTKTYHNAYASLNDPRNSVCNCNSYFFALLRPVQNEGDDIFLVLDGGKERCW